MAAATLQVEGVENAWGAGDAVAVPDLTKPGEFTAPNAQHAVRQARQLADNILAVLRGRPPEALRAQATSGRSRASGCTRAWRRSTASRSRAGRPGSCTGPTTCPACRRSTARCASCSEWTLALFFKREVVPLGWLDKPFEEFEIARRPAGSAGPTGRT